MIRPAPTSEVPDALALEAGLPFAEVEQRIGLAYAAGRFGMSRREARDLLAAGRALVELPEIDRAFAEGRLCWSKVRQLIKVVVPRHEQAWLEVALRLHTDELALEVKLSRRGDPPRRRDDRKGLPEIRLRLNTAMPPDVFAKWQQVRQKLRDESGGSMQEWECLEALLDRELARRDDDDGSHPADSPYAVVVRTATDDEDASVETEDGPVPLDPATAAMIACDAGVVDPTLDDHEADRRIPPARRRRVLARDKHRCRHCGSPHRLHLHHIIPWSQGGRSEIRNLITLCRTCHALVHAGLLVLVGDARTCRFETCEGRDLHGAGAAPVEFLADPPLLTGSASPPATALVRLQDVPARVDQAWWRRHAHLLRWVGGRGTYELQPGRPLSREDAVTAEPARTRCPDRIGTVCQPRPARLDEIVGQRAVVGEIRTAVAAARMTGEAASHLLLAGPPGLGKTTLARAVATDLGVRLHGAAGPFIRSTEALVRLLAGLGERDVLCVDEVHALAPGVAEGVYEAIEDRQVSLMLSSGAMARSITLELPPFTMVGATTDAGLLPEAFLSRFVYRHLLEFYAAPELAVIVQRAASGLGIEIEPQAAGNLAEVSRGTPRRALALLQRLRHEAVVAQRPVIDVAHVARTLEREHEPYPIHLGLITITPAGRILTPSFSRPAA